MGLELSHTQFEVCKHANGQFCHISMPFQPLANPPTCIAALYAKSVASIESKCSLQLHKATATPLPTQIMPDVWILATPTSAPTDTISLICPEKPMETIPIRQPLHVLKLPMACSATSANFYLPPRYETPILDVNVSLNMANLQAINITALHFCIWQHMGRNHSETELQHLATLPSVPVHKVYQHLLNSSLQLTPFNMQPSEDTNTLWDLFTHPGIYVSALGSLIPVGIGLFCCYFFWCRPARLACQPLKSGTMQYTIVDDNVEEAPIYRCEGKAPKPTRPHENHGLAIEHLPTQSESHQKPQLKSFAVPAHGIWNAAVASLQFWAEDLDPVTLGIDSEHVYNHFFWTSTSHTLCQLSEETLFGCFILALNAAFTQQLSLADEGYESGSNTDLPTPLCKMPYIHHISSIEHASFDLAHSTPCRPVTSASDLTYTPARPVHRCLSFSSDSNPMDTSNSSSDTTPESSDIENRGLPDSTYR